MKRIKSKIKSATRLPGNAAVMSMMAVILLFAAPALVSIIDDTVNEEYDMPLSVDLSDAYITTNSMMFEGEPFTDYEFDTIIEDNEISILSSTPGFTGRFLINSMDKAIINDTSKIVITTSSEYSEVSVSAGNNLIKGTYDPEFGEYTIYLSSIDRHYIMETESDYFRINVVNKSHTDKTFEAVETFTIDVYGSVMIPYDEIIIGATGVLLLICALLATPWVGLSGYTGRRISRRR